MFLFYSADLMLADHLLEFFVNSEVFELYKKVSIKKQFKIALRLDIARVHIVAL